MSLLSFTARRCSFLSGALALLATPSFSHVDLLVPNGGEVLNPGSTFAVQWRVKIKHNQLDWDLWYSTTSNSGPWTSIAMNLPPGSFAVGSIHTYDWTVPAIASGSVWVRVRMDNSGTNYYDVSDNPFAIGASALATVRNGSGVNTNCYSSTSLPLIGGTWTVEVDHSGHPGATLTYILGYAGCATGPVIGAGELLINLTSPKLFVSLKVSSGTSDTHSFAIPNDPSFSGAQATTQAVIFGGSPELCNAIDVTVGF